MLGAWVFIALTAAVSAQGQTDDLDPNLKANETAVFECEPGFKVASMERLQGADGFAGAMSVTCEPVDPMGSPVEAECTLCSEGAETIEGCKGAEYLGGLHLTLLDPDHGSYLWEPLCCTSPSVGVGECAAAKRVTSLTTSLEPFSVPFDKVIRGLSCWPLLDSRTNRLYGAIYFAEVCGVTASGGGESVEKAGEGTCDSCTCKCGPFTCPEGYQANNIVHKRRKRAAKCECQCQCNFVCTPISK